GAGIEVDRGSVVRLIVGLLVGGVIYAASAVTISLAAGPLSIVAAPAPVSAWVVLTVVASFLALSAMEELGFRGYPLRALTGAIGMPLAHAITAIAFGLSHLLYGWSWSAVLVGVIPSGLLFGAAAVAGRGLAFPIGVHAALNLAAWTIGMKDTPGPWVVALTVGTEQRIGQAGPWVGLGVTLAATLILFRVRDHRLVKRLLVVPM
ncbi:MAG: CPBP family intramembrane metalloprotease, partial [Actinomycetota bacterium]|nr:CPBP family intramembrane metalloprotease [Actinomycetota bacterium]